VAGLTREIMTLQAEGDYARAQGLIERLGVIRPEPWAILTGWRPCPWISLPGS
jgi:hypothetical protein